MLTHYLKPLENPLKISKFWTLIRIYWSKWSSQNLVSVKKHRVTEFFKKFFGWISYDKSLSKYLIILGIGLKMTVTFMDFPQSFCDHMPEKLTPLPIMGSKIYWFVIYHWIYWCSCRGTSDNLKMVWML